MSEVRVGSSKSELLPCPFCGGEASVQTTYGYGVSEAFCFDCGAHTGYPPGGCTEAEAIEAWNSRAERTCEFTPDGMMDDRLWYSCSNCGGYITTDYGMPSYCPHCGAEVRNE